MEFHGTRQKFHGIPWNFSMSRGKFHGIPWNFESSMELDANTKFHGIPWNSMESPDLEQNVHRIPWNLKSSMEFGYITKFHGIQWNHYNQLRISMEFHGIPKPSWEVPWNSMKLRKFHGTWSDTKFHRTLVPPNGLSPSSIEFHGILKELWCRQMKYHWVPWNSMELWDCDFDQYRVTLDLHGIFHGIPCNAAVAK